MSRDYKEKIKATVAAAVARAGNASILGRKLGASRQQVSLWVNRGKINLDNYLAVLEYLDGESGAREAVTELVKGPCNECKCKQVS